MLKKHIDIYDAKAGSNAFATTHVRAAIDGTQGNDHLIGTAGDDVLRGLGGNDILEGLDGNDTLNGGAGKDTLYGGAGNDILNGGSGNDYLEGGTGIDTYYYNGGNDTIASGTFGLDANETLILEGISFSDVTVSYDIYAPGLPYYHLTFASAAGSVDVSMSTEGVFWLQFTDGTYDINTVTVTMNGSAGNDYFTALDQPAIQNGLGGNDQLMGGSYNDVLNGGDGDDVLRGYGGDDILDGGAGQDIYYYDGGHDTILSGNNGLDANEILVMQGIYSTDVTVVYNLADTGLPYLHLNVGSTGGVVDVSMIQNGPFLIQFVDGQYDINTMTVTMEGTSGNDLFSPVGAQSMIENGYAGNDNMMGGASDDQLYGGKGDDILKGWDGNDLLVGGKGFDTLTGGNGADTFYFIPFGNVDTVTDFNHNDGDKLDISQLLTDYDPVTDAITDFVQFTLDSNTGFTQMIVDSDGTGNGATPHVVAQFTIESGIPDYTDLVTTPQVA